MIQLFNGGKSMGSAVKFARFYLIVDPECSTREELCILLTAFEKCLKKGFGAVKGGEAVFKCD